MGIFDSQRRAVYTTYGVQLQFRSRVMGGVPKDPRLIEQWLRHKAGLTSQTEELRQATIRTLQELGAEVNPDMTFEEVVEASQHLAAHRNTNGFKRDEEKGLYLESRIVKAMLKEVCNILNAGKRWGITKKGPKNFLAERVFVDPDEIYLDRMEPDGLELFIGHTNGPKGPQSNLTYHEFCEKANVSFELKVAQADDVLDMDEWAQLWLLAEDNGLGALRSQGYGRFDVNAFDVLERCTTKPPSAKSFKNKNDDALVDEGELVTV